MPVQGGTIFFNKDRGTAGLIHRESHRVYNTAYCGILGTQKDIAIQVVLQSSAPFARLFIKDSSRRFISMALNFLDA